MCTTVPPAKSMARMPASELPRPFIRPLLPHTMCASGKYTSSIHPRTKSMSAEYFMRSAMAPTMRAGVMMANIIWYIANTDCDTQGA